MTGGRRRKKTQERASRRERGGARGKLMMPFKNAQSPHYPEAAVAKQAARVTFAVECETGCVRACVVQSVCACVCISLLIGSQSYPV